MKKCVFFLMVFLLNTPTVSTQEEDIEILREHLISDALNLGFSARTNRYIISDHSQAGQYLLKMEVNGSWADIDYDDKDNKWDPLKHLDRVLVMTLAYAKVEGENHQNPKLLAGLEKAIQYWYWINPVCKNWYKNEIAKQFYFNIIALLLQGEIRGPLLEKMVADLTPAPRMTGSNRTLLSVSVIYKGVLQRDATLIKRGIKGVTDQIVITTKEGVQPDYSFHQHGAFLYNGSYGFNFMRESLWLAAKVHGTRFAYSQEQIAILRNYYLQGTRRMIRGRYLDYNACGRRVGRPEGFKIPALELVHQMEQFMLVDPEFREIYQESKENILNNLPQAVLGNKHFWRSDYTIHARKSHFTSVKMCSKRTVGMEINMNAENKLGYWLPFGLTYIYRKGDEYSEIFPVWDWARLPGVTNPYLIIEPDRTMKISQDPEFVGGLSDGRYGISAMEFSKMHTKAKKAWFWFDEEWIALGAGINSENAAPIVTGINQTLQKGSVFVDDVEYDQIPDNVNRPTFVWHNQIGYVFPTPQDIHIKAGVQQGNMHRIYGLGEDRIFKKEVFSLWFDHGTMPQNEKYAYIVVPEINAQDINRYASQVPISILSNSPQIQAIKHNALGLIGIIFYQPGKFNIPQFGTIESDQPAIIMINPDHNQLAIADPTAKMRTIHVLLTPDQELEKKITIDLPEGGEGGKTMITQY